MYLIWPQRFCIQCKLYPDVYSSWTVEYLCYYLYLSLHFYLYLYFCLNWYLYLIWPSAFLHSVQTISRCLLKLKGQIIMLVFVFIFAFLFVCVFVFELVFVFDLASIVSAFSANYIQMFTQAERWNIYVNICISLCICICIWIGICIWLYLILPLAFLHSVQAISRCLLKLKGCQDPSSTS